MKQRIRAFFRTVIGFFKLNFLGITLGTLFYCFALTPSLLPRPPLYAGVIAGMSFVVGYTSGVGLSWLVRKVIHTELPKRYKRVAWRAGMACMVAVMIAYSLWNASWENQVRLLIGEPTEPDRHVMMILIAAFITSTLLLTMLRIIAWAIRRASTFAGRWIPQRFSTAAGFIAVTAILIFLYNGVLVKVFIDSSNATYSKKNSITTPGTVQPIQSERSGSPASLVKWHQLGNQGQDFVAEGPSMERLYAVSGKQPLQPIRTYVGLDAAPNPKSRASLAVRELERTNAFDRSVLVIMGTTGTGWIAPQMADSLEYIHNGDSAIVAMQYSYLPSWISFLVDQQKAADAGRELVDAVYAKWQTLPAGNRPQLVVAGLSLGSYSVQSAFSGVDDLQNRTSGALFVGSPNFSQPWGQFVSNRDEGSPEWKPKYNHARDVRFAATQQDITESGAWNKPRILYLQHASDPVVWWDFDLLWHQPEWLKEPRGPDVSPNMRWYPFATFAQVTVDQFFGVTVPNGHGHNYGDVMAQAWVSVTQPEDWSQAKTKQVQSIISRYPVE